MNGMRGEAVLMNDGAVEEYFRQNHSGGVQRRPPFIYFFHRFTNEMYKKHTVPIVAAQCFSLYKLYTVRNVQLSH